MIKNLSIKDDISVNDDNTINQIRNNIMNQINKSQKNFFMVFANVSELDILHEIKEKFDQKEVEIISCIFVDKKANENPLTTNYEKNIIRFDVESSLSKIIKDDSYSKNMNFLKKKVFENIHDSYIDPRYIISLHGNVFSYDYQINLIDFPNPPESLWSDNDPYFETPIIIDNGNGMKIFGYLVPECDDYPDSYRVIHPFLKQMNQKKKVLTLFRVSDKNVQYYENIDDIIPVPPPDIMLLQNYLNINLVGTKDIEIFLNTRFYVVFRNNVRNYIKDKNKYSYRIYKIYTGNYFCQSFVNFLLIIKDRQGDIDNADINNRIGISDLVSSYRSNYRFTTIPKEEIYFIIQDEKGMNICYF